MPALRRRSLLWGSTNVNRQFGGKWVAVAAGVEAFTAVVLIIRPSLFGQLVFGAEFSPLGQTPGGLAGFALLTLALAFWLRGSANGNSVIRALVVFSLLTAIYLVYLGVGSAFVGILRWPAVGLHAVLSFLLIRGWLSSHSNESEISRHG